MGDERFELPTLPTISRDALNDLCFVDNLKNHFSALPILDLHFSLNSFGSGWKTLSILELPIFSSGGKARIGEVVFFYTLLDILS